MKITKQQLADLLEEAQAAHHEYAKSLEEEDDNWSEWYAQYIQDNLHSN